MHSIKLLLCNAFSQVLEMSHQVGREDHRLGEEAEDLEDLVEAEDSIPGKLLLR